MMDPWWTNEAGVWIGSIGGAGVGILGGLLGTLMGVLGSRGKARGLVMGLQVGVAALGAVTLLAGVVGLVMGQPYVVWYPLVLMGLIGGGVFGGLLPVTRRVYRQAEARRLEAEQLRRDGTKPLDKLESDR